MAPLAPAITGGVFCGAITPAFILDSVKVLLYRRLEIA